MGANLYVSLSINEKENDRGGGQNNNNYNKEGEEEEEEQQQQQQQGEEGEEEEEEEEEEAGWLFTSRSLRTDLESDRGVKPKNGSDRGDRPGCGYGYGHGYGHGYGYGRRRSNLDARSSAQLIDIHFRKAWEGVEKDLVVPPEGGGFLPHLS